MNEDEEEETKMRFVVRQQVCDIKPSKALRQTAGVSLSPRVRYTGHLHNHWFPPTQVFSLVTEDRPEPALTTQDAYRAM